MKDLLNLLKNQNQKQEFDAIRPYSDEETGTAINNLVRDPEFLDMIGRFKSPTLAKWAPGMLRVWVKRWLASLVGCW